LDNIVGAEVFFKAECFQRTGSFKFRGAINSVMKLSPEEAKLGVVTHSSGNHGQALAAAAQLRGIPATIVAPNTTAAVKLDSIRSYGANLVLCEPTQSARVEAMEAEATRMGGAVVLPPYDHLDIISGQGTMALELFDEVPDLDAILVPTSGGGMMSGICTVAAVMQPKCRVIAVEPDGKALGEALASGTRVVDSELANVAIPTIVDAMPTRCLGPLCWEHILKWGDRTVYTVTDEQVEEAMAFVYGRMKVVIEPAAATGVAALLGRQHQSSSEPIRGAIGGTPKIGVILCGGNLDLASLQARFAHLQ